jgi:hypothetical protein
MEVAGLSRVNTTRIVLATSFVGGGYGATAVIEIVYEDDLQRSED